MTNGNEFEQFIKACSDIKYVNDYLTFNTNKFLDSDLITNEERDEYIFNLFESNCIKHKGKDLFHSLSSNISSLKAAENYMGKFLILIEIIYNENESIKFNYSYLNGKISIIH